MGADEHREKAPKSITYAIITVSDTRTEKDDYSGMAISEVMSKAGHRLAKKAIVKDEVVAIQSQLRELIEDSQVQAIILNGGTGIAGRDVTLEAVSHFEEKPLPGFGELFRMLSYREVGSAAQISRATAFLTERKLVFCLPGSEKAVRLAVRELIAPEIGHIVWEAQR